MSSKLVSLTCNHCGAPLEVPEGTRFLTCSYCSSRLQVEHKGNAWYTSVLERIEKQTEAVADDLETIKLQNELERIDREWVMEKDQYMIRGKHGTLREPTSGPAGILIGIFVICFGLFWTVMAAAIFPPMALFGLIFIGFAIANIATSKRKAKAYDAARARYDARRRELLRELREAR